MKTHEEIVKRYFQKPENSITKVINLDIPNATFDTEDEEIRSVTFSFNEAVYKVVVETFNFLLQSRQFIDASDLKADDQLIAPNLQKRIEQQFPEIKKQRIKKYGKNIIFDDRNNKRALKKDQENAYEIKKTQLVYAIKKQIENEQQIFAALTLNQAINFAILKEDFFKITKNGVETKYDVELNEDFFNPSFFLTLAEKQEKDDDEEYDIFDIIKEERQISFVTTPNIDSNSRIEVLIAFSSSFYSENEHVVEEISDVVEKALSAYMFLSDTSEFQKDNSFRDFDARLDDFINE